MEALKSLLAKPLENYCQQHSTPPHPILKELETYTKQNTDMPIMLSGPWVASLLSLLVTAKKPKTLLEIGCFTGYSALTMALAAPPEAKIYTIEPNARYIQIAQHFWKKANVFEKIKVLQGKATELLPKFDQKVDFAFIDAIKTEYNDYFNQLLPKLNPGAIVACDNCLQEGRVFSEKEKDERAKAIDAFNKRIASQKDLIASLIPIRDGILLITKNESI